MLAKTFETVSLTNRPHDMSHALEKTCHGKCVTKNVSQSLKCHRKYVTENMSQKMYHRKCVTELENRVIRQLGLVNVEKNIRKQ